ncbi:MAG: dihydrolipoyllysine-residue acetyltransferase [Gammaproteobacteria bacterium]
MTKLTEVQVPDIGNFAQVAVIEVHVKPGDTLNVDDNIVTLESDKAAMEIPSPYAGKVKEVKVKVGDKVSKGSLILLLETAEATQTSESAKAEKTAPATQEVITTVAVPDIGNAKQVTVIEINVKEGDTIAVEAPVVTLESEKASMEVPAPISGVVKRILTKIGAQVSEGTPLIEVLGQATATASAPQKPAAATKAESAPLQEKSTATVSSSVLLTSPAVRRLARELDLDITRLSGTGEKGRITKEDVKRALQGSSTGAGLPAMPVVDFTQWGEVESKPLSRIQKLSAAALHRNWVNIPHVTQFDNVDISEMEEFRQTNKNFAEKAGVKLTPLVFLMKAAVAALRAHPTFNSSLAADGQNIILKNYYHIGVAVDTPNGLVVPVIRDVDKKGLLQLAKELADISAVARAGKLSADQMQGSCFSISSLGGIGGTAFTPIINAPDVAILGVSKSQIQPIYIEGEFVPRLMLPLSLSYDHRVIDGAVAARFITTLGEFLQDVRRLLL